MKYSLVMGFKGDRSRVFVSGRFHGCYTKMGNEHKERENEK